ncbi:HNH endonuclease [compost metagenome]
MVECLICGQKMRWIQNTHMKRHGMTTTEYLEKYPGAKLKDDAMTKVLSETRHKAVTKKCASPDCNNVIKGKSRKYCSYACNNHHRVLLGTNAVVKYGVENHMYKDGLSSNSRKTQKVLAYERDGKCCQKCGKDVSSAKYGIHHMIPKRLFDDYREADQLWNLITLCSKCHKQVEADTLNLVFKLFLQKQLKEMDELVSYIKAELVYN